MKALCPVDTTVCGTWGGYRTTEVSVSAQKRHIQGNFPAKPTFNEISLVKCFNVRLNGIIMIYKIRISGLELIAQFSLPGLSRREEPRVGFGGRRPWPRPRGSPPATLLGTDRRRDLHTFTPSHPGVGCCKQSAKPRGWTLLLPPPPSWRPGRRGGRRGRRPCSRARQVSDPGRRGGRRGA